MTMKIKMTHDKRLILKTAAIVSAGFFLLHGIIALTTHKKSVLPPSPVVLQKPKLSNITEYITQTGTMVAYNSVDLVARVEGYLEGIHFTDGTFVKKDKELFVIQPKPYLEQLKAAQATVVVQKAEYLYDSSEYARQKKMYQQSATSLNNVEKWSAKSQESKAEIDKSVANEEIAAITYSYTHVLAPFDGRIGRHLVDVGNLVGHGQATDLATIQQLDPIYVYFNLNELDLIKIRKAAKDHAFDPKDINTVPVSVRMQNETKFVHTGKLDFVNTALNASTGTMEFRAILSNKDYTLLPGLFVEVRIPIANPTPQLTVPDIALQYDQIGAYLLIADNDRIVVQKRVVVGMLEQGMRAVVKGLDAKDDVIISGLQNAIPGQQVMPVNEEKKE